MTRRDALKAVGAGIAGVGVSLGIRYGLRAARVDACFACGQGPHVKRVTYTRMYGSSPQVVTYSAGVDDRSHGFANVCSYSYIEAPGVGRSGECSPQFHGEPEWVCLACGTAWGYTQSSPGFFARLRPWLGV